MMRTIHSVPEYSLTLPENIQTRRASPAIPAGRKRQNYPALWQVWQDKAAPGSGEMRDIAVGRLQECLKWRSPVLDLQDLNLSSLPPLPHHIDTLQLGHNQLLELPPLPPALRHLMVDHNRLRWLPELPATLIRLAVQHNQLSELPTPPVQLSYLNASHNQLLRLPLSLSQLPTGAFIDISHNPLTRHSLLSAISFDEDGNSLGQHVAYSMPQQSDDEILAGQLGDSVSRWFPLAEQEQIATIWDRFSQQENAAAFSDFISRLRDTINAEHMPGFMQHVAGWLNKLASASALRSLTFAVAQEAESSCEDQLTLKWNELQKVALAWEVENGRYDQKLPQLIAIGREMFRLEQLEQIARETVATQRAMLADYPVDEVEVFLAYQVKLREKLRLSIGSNYMHYPDEAALTRDHISRAARRVRQQENREFGRWLAQWTPWQRVLERIDSEAWQRTITKRYAALESHYPARVAAETATLQLSGIADAEAQVGKQVMNELDQKLFSGLTRTFLRERGLLKLLNKPWKSRRHRALKLVHPVSSCFSPLCQRLFQRFRHS